MRTRALLAAPTIALAATPPATAGGGVRSERVVASSSTKLQWATDGLRDRTGAAWAGSPILVPVPQ
jgi:hypothetical protein